MKERKVSETMMRIAIGFLGLCLAAMILACSPAAQTTQVEPSNAAETSSDLFIRIIKTTADHDKGVLEKAVLAQSKLQLSSVL